jgi:hypothetical protein
VSSYVSICTAPVIFLYSYWPLSLSVLIEAKISPNCLLRYSVLSGEFIMRSGSLSLLKTVPMFMPSIGRSSGTDKLTLSDKRDLATLHQASVLDEPHHNFSICPSLYSWARYRCLSRPAAVNLSVPSIATCRFLCRRGKRRIGQWIWSLS